MRILFFCGHESRYGAAHLAPILESGFEVVAVVLATEERWAKFRRALLGRTLKRAARRRGGRLKRLGRMIRPSRRQRKRAEELDAVLARANAEAWRVEDVGDPAFLERVRRAEPDLIVSSAYPQIFPKALLEIPRRGAVNFHPSLLPKFRGAHPHFWAIATGAQESGVTAHFMTERVDEGDIVAQRRFQIADYNYEQLYDRIVEETPALVADVERFFRDGGVATAQDPALATTYRNDRDVHRKIAWGLHSAREIVNLARTGQAFFFLERRKVLLTEARGEERNRNMTNDVRVECGTVVDLSEAGPIVRVKEGFVCLAAVKDGRKLAGSEWAESVGLQIGETLG